ncbi:MAG TPA: hypothetical protein VL443_08300 [Cyclobacteriaceae bacterium]|jgi:hypothetical protein|nr:hypothetical protein [Cyclobacteriaceae bacterium]
MSAILTIGGNEYTMIEDQYDQTNTVDERQRLRCDVIDYSGTAHFVKGERVIVTDPNLGIVFNGFLNDDKEVPQYPSRAILHTIDCIDLRYLADKRTYTKLYDTPQLAGKLVVDQLQNVLDAEGIAKNYAQQSDNTQNDFNNGELNGVVGKLSITDGNLELSPAGSDITIVEDTAGDFSSGTLTKTHIVGSSLLPTTVNALKMQSTLSFAYGTEFVQAQQTAAGSMSGSAIGGTSGTVNSSGYFTPSGYVYISGGAPGESASFSGSFTTVNVSGTYSDTLILPVSGSVSARVSKVYQPKTKSKVKVDNKHYDVVTVDAAVADNRVDAIIWTGSFVIASHDTLNYDLWISSTSPSQEGGIDLLLSDGTFMTEYLGSIGTNTDVGLWDQNRVSASPIQDLQDYAKDCWYTRQIDLSILAGKTIVGVSMFNAANVAGVFDIYIKNCFLGSKSTTPFFGTTQTAPEVNPPVLSSVGAYVTAATIVTAVSVYDPSSSFRISPAYNIDSVKLVKDSLITWTAALPTIGPSVVPDSPGVATVASTMAIFASYDGTTWLPCVNNQALPGLPAGANVSGGLLYILETFSGGQDPSAIPALLQVNISITSAAHATTTDLVSLFGSTTAWNSGTLLGVAPNSEGDLALGTTVYSWSNLSNITFVPGHTDDADVNDPVPSVSGGALVIHSDGDSDATSWSSTRFNFISAAQNFTAQGDFTLNGGSSPIQNEIGFVYRQTYWGAPNNSFAYYVRIMQNPGGTAGGTSVSLCYGQNSPPDSGDGSPAAATITVIAKVNLTVSNNTSYHVKLVVGDNRHTIYWNNGTTPIIDVLDNTYTQPGNIGVRTYIQTADATTNRISNFSVTNTFAGIWTSPPINLNSIGTCGNTQISWSEVNSQGAIQATAIVMASLNNGLTWQQCTNGGITPGAFIPGLTPGTSTVGKTLILQVILSATSFLNSPIIDGLYVRVCGAYPGSSGIRSTAPLCIDTMIRGNVANGWGTAFDSQIYVKSGTGTTSITSNKALISNTAGDVSMQLGTLADTNEDGTVRFSLSTSTILAGISLRYVDTNNFYQLRVNSTTVSIVKKLAGTTLTLASVNVSLNVNTLYRMRFRIVGYNPVLLFGNVWSDGDLENTIDPTTKRWNNNLWTIKAID